MLFSLLFHFLQNCKKVINSCVMRRNSSCMPSSLEITQSVHSPPNSGDVFDVVSKLLTPYCENTFNCPGEVFNGSEAELLQMQDTASELVGEIIYGLGMKILHF